MGIRRLWILPLSKATSEICAVAKGVLRFPVQTQGEAWAAQGWARSLGLQQVMELFQLSTS